MIITDIDETHQTGTIVLRPNSSWSWHANLLFLSILMLVSLTIGFSFLIAGAWLVLPFSVLEMTFVVLCIHYCVRQCSRQEVIRISDHEVRIERGIREASQKETFQRIWAKFLVQPPKHPWDPAALFIQSHGRKAEIGSFLNRRDKYKLVSLLKQLCATCQS